MFLLCIAQYSWSEFRPKTLWTVDANADVKGNWAHLIDGDANPSFIEISDSHFSIGTWEFSLPR